MSESVSVVRFEIVNNENSFDVKCYTFPKAIFIFLESEVFDCKFQNQLFEKREHQLQKFIISI